MTELEKLEKELLEEIQEEPEIYADTEEFCTINPETRIITVPTSKRILGTESDQETNRLYFKCPKVVGDNIDLSLFSLRINYQNAGNKKDQYLVEDVKEEGDNITFSWLLKRNVTAYKGNVKFILCAVKTTEDGIIKNEWNTTLNTECESLEGMEVDKAVVEEETKDIVEQLIAMMNQSAKNAVHAVEETKAKVDKEVEDFALKAQQALADVNNAGQAQTERVQTAGNDAVESIKVAQGTATRAVETAKTEAIKAVQTEGTTQTGNVAAEGKKQVQAVRGAAQEIIADREQIQMNKEGVAKLKEDIGGLQQNKADAIVETASGTILNVKDSAFAKIVNLEIDKNVDWLKVTGKNLLNVQGEKTGTNINLMEFGVGRIKYTTQDNYGGGYVKYSKIFEAGEYVFFAKTTNDGVVDNNGTRLGFDKEVSVKNNQLIYNNYYKMYFMENYSNKIQITASKPFTMMISVNLKSSVKGSLVEIFDIQLEQGTVNTEYESYCEEQNVVAPITEDKINALHTNYPTTIVTNSEDTEMQLTYVADTKNYYLNREQVLQKQILEIQNALISQKISGGGIKVTDSAKLPLQNLRIFGKSEQNGVPSLDAPVPIVNVGEKGNVDIKINTGNLFDINTVKKYEVDNTTLSLSVSGNKIIFNSKISTGKEAIVFIINKLDDMLRLLPGKYTLSYNSNKPFGATNGTDTVEMFVCIHNNGSTRFHSTGNKNWTQFEIKEGDRTYLRFDINKSGQSAEFYDIMLNHGESVLPYEPYFNQSLTLSTPNGLPGIKVDSGGNYTDATGQQWICDEIDLARGKYIQRIEKKIIKDMNLKYLGKTVEGNCKFFIEIEQYDTDIYIQRNIPSLCDIFKLGTSKNKFSYSTLYTSDWKGMSRVNFTVDESINTIEEFKKLVGEARFYYKLKEQIERNLPPETTEAFKSLYTNYPSTVISNDENAGMEVSYVADTKHYIDKKFEELNQAIVNTQIALL